MRYLAIFIVLMLAALPARAEEPKPLTDEAQRVYEQYGDAVYQVQVIDLTTGRKSGIGSGFQFSPDGLMATNYHVVASAVRAPEANRLEFLDDKGGKGNLVIRAVDVARDLAVLQMDVAGKTHVTLGSSARPKGARIFSLGNPHDIGFTIIEGTYNGLSRESFADKIHFSGALNPGMSGGPALSHNGQVIGINVSTAGNQISFLVPVEPLAALEKLVRAQPQGFDFTKQADKDIESQLLKNQQRIVDALLNAKWDSTPFGPLSVPGRVHPALKCWGVPQHEEKDPYRHYLSVCNTEDDLYLDEGFSAGSYNYQYDFISAKDGMDAVRFNAYYQTQYALPTGDGQAREDDVTNYTCHTGFVSQADHKWKSSFCVRQYKRYPALYDMGLYMASVDDTRQGMLVALDVSGVSRENALKLAGRFMRELKPIPASGIAIAPRKEAAQ
jgi:serine protease Do